MFGSKKRSWYWLAMLSLLFSGIIYSVSRFFLHAVDKESGRATPKKRVNFNNGTVEELFI
jgi:hypothetical protein